MSIRKDIIALALEKMNDSPPSGVPATTLNRVSDAPKPVSLSLYAPLDSPLPTPVGKRGPLALRDLTLKLEARAEGDPLEVYDLVDPLLAWASAQLVGADGTALRAAGATETEEGDTTFEGDGRDKGYLLASVEFRVRYTHKRADQGSRT